MQWNELSVKEQTYKQLMYEKDPVFFVEDECGLGIALWPKQKEIIQQFYQSGVNELVLVAGMGGSKTSILCFLSCIELKTLLSIDWTKKLNVLPHSPLFVTVASISEKQALDAVWSQISPLINESSFFQAYEPEVLSDMVRFKRKPNIKLRLLSASASTAVGRRNKFVGIDEMAKFEQTAGPKGGWQVYNSLKASTRLFGQYGRMAVAGSPKHPADILMTLYRKAQTTKGMLGLHYATWDLNPNTSKADYAKEFEIDSNAALCNYAAEPYAGTDMYFPNRDIFDFSNEQNVLEFIKDGVEIHLGPFDYVLAGDPALRRDNFGLALGHKENETIVIDGALAIGAEKEINPLEVQAFIMKIAGKAMLRSAVFDTWYFPETLELLKTSGVEIVNRIVRKQEYDNFKRLVYLKKVILPNYPLLKEELFTLITNGQRVDHPRRGSKDVADAVVNVVAQLSGKASQIVHTPIVARRY